jgi:hypothetical protein
MSVDKTFDRLYEEQVKLLSRWKTRADKIYHRTALSHTIGIIKTSRYTNSLK